ncbi:MAG TPA: SpvB/TcaC N-terminal domain-containing protein [Ktedonobacterales bacterium]|nr:SpvB/TcaC N-terminal domain-containing protein [Ktedonobacterales bacterium]
MPNNKFEQETEAKIAPSSSKTTAEATSLPLPVLSLPKGGGAIKGIGEKFAGNPATGTASLTVPIAISQGRPGFGPQMSLAYDSGAGNGPFGFGWSLSLPSITRKTDKGLPRYLDAEESDVFILSGAEDLVSVLDGSGQRLHTKRTVHNINYEVAFYRPRIESLFARIERWVAVDTGISHWRSITRDNITTLYGFDENSRIADPNDPRKIFSYHICRTFDNKGNLTLYEYVAEDGAGINHAQAHEVNRSDTERAAQRYLKRIRSANAQPYFPDWSAGGTEPALPTDWHMEVVLDYGDHSPDAPTPTPDRAWPVRPDPFSSYRAGFEVRTYRRGKRALVFHHFPAEEGIGANYLVRSTDFVYSDEQAPADPRNPIYTFLQSVTQSGCRRQGDGYQHASLPPLEFEYSRPQVQPDVLTLDASSLANLPEGLDGSRYQWVDLDGEGLSGILTDLGDGWGYKRNLSPLNQITLPDGSRATRARFDALEVVAALPSRSTFGGGQQFLDLSGGGRLDLVAFDETTPGFFKRTPDEDWAPFKQFASLPRLDWSEPNLKFVDVTGDGLADILITEDGLFTFYPSLGEAGFSEAELARTPWDEERGPKLVLADGTQTIFLADMTGDGLSDLVRVRNGEVCYWPNLGYGRFGARVIMDGSPRFTNEERFDPRRVRLADIDGSGTTDLLYIGDDGVLVCFNQSGNAWAEPHRLAVFPSTDSLSAVQVTDLLGTGTACLVWSSPLPGEATAPLRYVDLMGGQKPHLLTRMRNNLGAETRLSYAPSTRFYLADKLAGRPWVTRLPFPVHALERIEVYDWIGRSRFVTRYAYHHGYFDGYEREFRGFGMVEQWDSEEHRGDTAFPAAANWDAASWTPPMLSRTWFHTGAMIEAGLVSRQYAHEYWTEPALRPDNRAADREAMLLPDTVLPSGLTADEVREAYRALKGMALRIEIYAADGSPRAEHPYAVTEQNFTARMVQPMAGNRHSVFFVHPRETLAFNYERQPDDPRVTHDLTLEVDDFGNVRRSVSVGYPRRMGYPDPEPTLSLAFRGMLAYDQTRLHIGATERRYTNALADPAAQPDIHRTPLPSETITAELTGLTPAANRPGITNLFRFDELDTLWQTVWDDAHDVAYEEIPGSDVDGAGALPKAPTRRIVEQTRTRYRSDDFTYLLALGQLESLALPGGTYHLALTPSLISRIFGNLVPSATLTEGGYVQLPNDSNWWMPSGYVFYSPGDADTPAQERAEARAHFYLPRRAIDAFGAISRVTYDAYDLLVASATDPVGNTTAAVNDYRVLRPARITDPNGNRAEVAFDALGFVVGTAVMGKATENLGDSLAGFTADLDQSVVLAHLADPLNNPAAILGNASSRLLYDLFAYNRTRDQAQPDAPMVYTLARETHVSDLAPNQTTHYQHLLVYSDGFGREVQRKVQADAGPVEGVGQHVAPRWVGSGWTIYNNKGKPVRNYEPFFTATHRFEFAQQVGVSTILFYDPPGRVVATVHPDNTWEKVIFDQWRQETWDANDTVLVADPRADADVGDYFRRLFGNAPDAFTSWYNQRIGGTWGTTPEERAAAQDAAQKTAAHAATPTVAHFDALGRTCLTVADNGAGQRYPGRTALDAESKPLALFDAQGRRVFEYCLREAQQSGGFRYIAGYDLAGNLLYQNSTDSGARRSLSNVAGKLIRSWDARNHAFRMRYDLLQRPTHHYVSTSGSAELLLAYSVYGEGQADRNLCGRLLRQYDPAGLASNERYDFKGNLLESARQFAREYRQSVDWSALANLTNAAALDAASASLLVAADRFLATTTYDALNRSIQMVTPHSAGMRPNVLRPSYSEANLLNQLDVWLQQASAPTGLLDPTSADLHAVTSISYNARGQRTQLAPGNGVITTFDYDPQTFLLTHLTTTRPNSFAADQRVVQDLAYTYDPVGNITSIRDNADTQNAIYFQNQRVEPSTDYIYDALYRLMRATGREHLGQNGGTLNAPAQITNDDSPRVGLAHPGDGKAMGTYTETYIYDPVGNLLAMLHQVSSGAWTRQYAYAEPSQIVSTETSNRLSATSLPGDPTYGPYSARYSYDTHGNMTQMPHLPSLTWDEQDRLHSTTRQIVNAGTPETTFYSYDAGGQRLRKVTDRQGPANQTGTRRTERLYVNGIEIYREFSADGTTVTLQRETLHILTDTERVALVETRTVGSDPAPAQMVRYQYGNHLGSAALELDDHAEIISYEEYFPYGSSSYQAVRSQTVTSKRYRYTGKERDEESGLYYYGARYYASWLGRWTAADPAGIKDGLNLYAYVAGNPVRKVDQTGNAGLTVTLGDSTGTPEEDVRLMSAAYETTKRIKEDLSNYFGIDTEMGHDTKNYAPSGFLSCNKPPPAYGYSKITLKVIDDPAKQKAALDNLRNRLTAIEKSKGNASDEQISKNVEAKMKSLEGARNYLIASLKEGFDLEAQTRSEGKTLIGMDTTGSSDLRQGTMHVNPYTFFTEESGKWVDAIQGSSPQAKAAVSPGLQLLHELIHYRKKYIAGGSTPKQFDVYANDEEKVVEDVDKALASIPELVAQRGWYGRGKALFHGTEVKVDQGQPDQTYVLGPDGMNYKVTYDTLTGKEWIKWPTATQLTTGKK